MRSKKTEGEKKENKKRFANYLTTPQSKPTVLPTPLTSGAVAATRLPIAKALLYHQHSWWFFPINKKLSAEIQQRVFLLYLISLPYCP